MAKYRQWRVDYTHQMGYHAPSSFVYTDDELKWKAEVRALAQGKSTRLGDFECWRITVTCTERKLYNGKWYNREVLSEYLERRKKRGESY